MRRYLLAWELGGEPRHARQQAAIARGLRRLGHEVLLACADVTVIDAVAHEGIGWVAAPRVPLPTLANPAPVNFSDVLVGLGYADGASLSGALAGWAGLIRAYAPHALVGDFAPGAMLAARLAGIARIGVGTGYSTPLLGEPMPALRPDPGVPNEVLARSDAQLLAAMREAAARAAPRGPVPTRARDFFEADASIVCAWPELDPFGPREGVEYVGPQADGDADPRVPWSGSETPKVFADLDPRDEHFAALVDAIAQVKGEAIVAAPGLEASQAMQLTRDRVRVMPHALDLATMLAQADLCVSHADAGTVAAATAAGVPMALVPRNLEQWLIARRAQSLGHAVVPKDLRAQDLADWLGAALSREELKAAAHSARSVARPSRDAAERIAALG